MRLRVSLWLVPAVAVLIWPADAAPQSSGRGETQAALLRLATDSGVVGNYGFTTQETHTLAFDIAADDPRASMLSTVAGTKKRTTKIAVTIVALPKEPNDDRRYLIYWLAYNLTGDGVRSLTPIQWDSIFQAVGRRAIFKVSPTGEPRGVNVTSDAVRPVGQAFALMLSGLALDLPVDSVAPGATWQGQVAIPIRRPDGSRAMAPVQVTYRLRELSREPYGWIARIEFDGEPLPSDSLKATGRYFGEAVFDAAAGRFDDVMALAELEVEWPLDPNGLPPSRSFVTWQTVVTRTRTQ